MKLENYIASVVDYPKEGIIFRDITPLMADGDAFKYACDQITEFAKTVEAEMIAGPEARGFIFGCPVATNLNVGFAPIRKPGKLPREVICESYDLEYGSNTLCMHRDAIQPGQKVLLVDDLLATGGTVLAAVHLIEKLGGIVVGIACLIELIDLEGRKKLEGYNLFTLMEFAGE